MHVAISVMLIMKSMQALLEILVIKKDLTLFCIPPVLQGQMKEIQQENNDPSSLKKKKKSVAAM